MCTNKRYRSLESLILRIQNVTIFWWFLVHSSNPWLRNSNTKMASGTASSKMKSTKVLPDWRETSPRVHRNWIRPESPGWKKSRGDRKRSHHRRPKARDFPSHLWDWFLKFEIGSLKTWKILPGKNLVVAPRETNLQIAAAVFALGVFAQSPMAKTLLNVVPWRVFGLTETHPFESTNGLFALAAFVNGSIGAHGGPTWSKSYYNMKLIWWTSDFLINHLLALLLSLHSVDILHSEVRM